MVSVLQSQFRFPRGVVGRFVGWFMAVDNDSLNRMAIDWLEAGPDDQVLEIGSGPGEALALLAQRTSARCLAGIDPSFDMCRQALARNQESIAAGRMQLFAGEAAALPFADERFSRVMAVSNFHCWERRQAGLDEIYRVLRPGGLLVLCHRLKLQHPRPWSAPGISAKQLERDREQLAAAGFRDVQLATRKLGHRVVCMLARK